MASLDRLGEVRRWCDEVLCVLALEEFWAIGQFYEGFTQVEDEQVLELLRQAAAQRLVAAPGQEETATAGRG